MQMHSQTHNGSALPLDRVTAFPHGDQSSLQQSVRSNLIFSAIAIKRESDYFHSKMLVAALVYHNTDILCADGLYSLEEKYCLTAE